jgi:N-acetyl-D-muramate 6-phosphate phosphatase
VSFEAVLFDLDGTLVDTAPDLVGVLNQLLVEHGRPRMPYAIARNEVSNGAAGLLRLGFADMQAGDSFDALRRRFLDLYAERVCVNSKLFIEIDDFSENFPDVRWGIVTNKPDGLTNALLRGLGLAGRAGCVIGGDRLPQRKPDPAPLRLAAAEIGVPVARCVYIGDAPRDIEAGRAAGMSTIAAAYGYIRPHENVRAWGADVLLRQPAELAMSLDELRGRRRA